MSRIANIFNSIRNSGARLGPLDAAFGYLDYQQGKGEGEDDFRAAGGAAASTLGGWGGALAGGATGAALGSVVPGVGTLIGGAVGTVVGGMGGGFGGGWAFDRADEVVRGNTSNRGSRYYSQSKKNDLAEPLAAGAVLAGSGIAAAQLLKGKKPMFNPISEYKMLRGMGASRWDSLTDVAGRGGQYLVDSSGKIIAHPAAKIGAGVGAGVIANNMLGNPVGGAIDYATNGMSDFKANARDELGLQHEVARQKRLVAATGGADDALNTLDGYDDALKQFEALLNPNHPWIVEAEKRARRQDIWQDQRKLRDAAFAGRFKLGAANLDAYWQRLNNSANDAATLANAGANLVR